MKGFLLFLVILMTRGVSYGSNISSGTTNTPEIKDTQYEGQQVDVRSFMDGKSGRPTLATWQSNMSGVDVTSVILAASNTGKYVQFAPGEYLVSGHLSPSSMKWFSYGDTVVHLLDSTQIVSDGIKVDVKGMVFEGGMTSAQYTDGVRNSSIVEAIKSGTTYLDEKDTPYLGADFTHKQVGSYLSLSLGMLTGTTHRSFLSAPIPLDPAKRYVLNINQGALAETANFAGITIQKFDGNGAYVGEYSPNASSTELYLTGVSSIKFKVTLRRSRYSATVNRSTEIHFDQFSLFALANDAAKASIAGGYYGSNTYWQLGNCTSPIIKNCTFRYMAKVPVSLSSCTGPLIIKNTIYRCWSGFGSVKSSDASFTDNYIDLRQLHTDGNLYNIKFIRSHGIAGSTTSNVIITGNKIYGASWGIEYCPQNGYKTTVSNNAIFAEHVGVSVDSGIGSVIKNNMLEIAPGYPTYGIEVPGSHNDVQVSSNTITMGDTLSPAAYGVSVSMASSWLKGTIDGNKIKAPVGIYISSSSGPIASHLSLTNNHLTFSAAGIWFTNIGGDAVGNVITHDGDMFLPYISNRSIATGSSGQPITISKNKIDSGNEGVFSISHDNAIISNNLIYAFKQYPELITNKTASYHYSTNNTFFGTAPSSYFSVTGGGAAYSMNNKTNGGIDVPLGAVTDGTYFYLVPTVATGKLSAHTIQITMPQLESFAISVRCKIGNTTLKHELHGTFLFQNSNPYIKSTNDANDVSLPGSVTDSEGAPLADGVTMTATYNRASNVITIIVSPKGATLGQTAITAISVK